MLCATRCERRSRRQKKDALHVPLFQGRPPPQARKSSRRDEDSQVSLHIDLIVTNALGWPHGMGYFDENRDGRVSRNEFVNKPNPLFSRYDKNGDCKVTPAELKATLRDAKPSEKRGGGRS